MGEHRSNNRANNRANHPSAHSLLVGKIHVDAGFARTLLELRPASQLTLRALLNGTVEFSSTAAPLAPPGNC